MSDTRDTAPFRHDLAEGPDNGFALWRTADDGVRLRIGIWPAKEPVGTILLFNGRTEYIEKYGRVARDLTAAGYNVITPDWRGQGFSDRVEHDAMLGYVRDFRDYQKDVQAVLTAARQEGLTEPFYLLAHSMGGAIGQRALLEGLPVRRTVFSAPMWGILIAAPLRPLAPLIFGLVERLGLGNRYVPGIGGRTYILDTDFDKNTLTTDRDHWEYFIRQLKGEKAFGLGGAAFHWAIEAYREARVLQQSPRPRLPVLTFLGTLESIVDSMAIRQMMKDWPSAELATMKGSKHEGLMEIPAIREEIMERTIAFFDEDRA